MGRPAIAFVRTRRGRWLVRADGVHVGAVERLRNRKWLALAPDGRGLGVYGTRALAARRTAGLL